MVAWARCHISRARRQKTVANGRYSNRKMTDGREKKGLTRDVDSCGFMVGSSKESTHLWNSVVCTEHQRKSQTTSAETKKSIKILGRFRFSGERMT